MIGICQRFFYLENTENFCIFAKENKKQTKMEKLTFKQLTQNILRYKFGLQLVETHEVLTNWIQGSKQQTISEADNNNLIRLQKLLKRRCSAWNEFELSEWFIGPLMTLIEFEIDDYSLFAYYDLTAQIGDCELTGKPDVMFARGVDSPQMPYFFFNEYKRQTDPDGKPQSQLLGAMLAGQTLNNNEKPMYGFYVIGKNWTFVVLQGIQWCESQQYNSLNEGIFDIFKILKMLKDLVVPK